MTMRDFKKLVKRFGGWIEQGVAYFPSPHLKDEFLKAWRLGQLETRLFEVDLAELDKQALLFHL